MNRKYIYQNGVIYISMPDGAYVTIRNATETFLRRVVFENEFERNRVGSVNDDCKTGKRDC